MALPRVAVPKVLVSPRRTRLCRHRADSDVRGTRRATERDLPRKLLRPWRVSRERLASRRQPWYARTAWSPFAPVSICATVSTHGGGQQLVRHVSPFADLIHLAPLVPYISRIGGPLSGAEQSIHTPGTRHADPRFHIELENRRAYAASQTVCADADKVAIADLRLHHAPARERKLGLVIYGRRSPDSHHALQSDDVSALTYVDSETGAAGIHEMSAVSTVTLRRSRPLNGAKQARFQCRTARRANRTTDSLLTGFARGVPMVCAQTAINIAFNICAGRRNARTTWVGSEAG